MTDPNPNPNPNSNSDDFYTYDFNQEEQQRGGDDAIPSFSMVLVKLSFRAPKEAMRTRYPLVACTGSGILAFDAEYEVVSGTYMGNRIFEYIFLPNVFQVLPRLSEGQEHMCKAYGRKLRAMIEAVNNITPEDTSGRAQHLRKVPLDKIHGSIFPVKVGIKPPRAGDVYINNSVRRIVTPDRKEYAQLMAGGEIITDRPLPLIPAAPSASAGVRQSDRDAAGPAFPSEAAGMDDMPY
jgi:hypothetical protein